MPWWRRPPLRGYGRPFLAAACAYELTALYRPELPTISELVKRYPMLGVGILAALGHHFYLEADDVLSVAD